MPDQTPPPPPPPGSALSEARLMLARQGFDVLLAADGDEALRTFRELRALDPGVRVILASGYNEQDATSKFVGEGLAGFLQKPFTLEDLQTRIREALA